MADDQELEDTAVHRARLRAERRKQKRSPRKMAVSGKSVLLLKQIIDAKARAARSSRPKKTDRSSR
jgi:hypothetical protein